jgi:hypothetical protein
MGVKNWIFSAVCLLCCGFTPISYALFYNSLSQPVHVVLFNLKHEWIAEFNVGAGAVAKARVVNGSATFGTANHGSEKSAPILAPDHLNKCYDFDRKLYYYKIVTQGLIPADVTEGCRWKVPKER